MFCLHLEGFITCGRVERSVADKKNLVSREVLLISGAIGYSWRQRDVKRGIFPSD